MAFVSIMSVQMLSFTGMLLAADNLRYFDMFTLQLCYRVPQGSSGPFGEDTYGPWWTKTEIAQRYSDIRRRFFAAGVPIEQCWYDLHASRVMNDSRP